MPLFCRADAKGSDFAFKRINVRSCKNRVIHIYITNETFLQERAGIDDTLLPPTFLQLSFQFLEESARRLAKSVKTLA